ncbi:MAG: hypothetical protein V3S72_01090 [Desulfobacterales bacterium]
MNNNRQRPSNDLIKTEDMYFNFTTKRDWFGDLDVGLKMLAKRKLDLVQSKVKDIGDIKKLVL